MSLRIALLAILLSATVSRSEPKDEKKKFTPVGPVQLTEDGDKWAEKTLKSLSTEEKIGQLLMVRALAEFQNVESADYQKLRSDIQRFHIGSVALTVRTDAGLLLRNQPYEAAMITNRLQGESKLPLLFAADFERGLSMRLLATPAFPHAMAFAATGNPQYAERFGAAVAREARAIGVHWNFFPVADVNSNPANPIINTRSFGEDPNQVGEFLAAYIKGSRQGGALSTAKHFPGHGDTDTDTHLALARSGLSLEQLRQTALPPFQAAINAGVDSVMVAHVTVPALDPDPNRVATLSRKVVTDLLINQMQFGGLVVTDAMDMRALTRVYHTDARTAAGRAAVDAILAGNDMILLPSDLDGAYAGLLAAANSGEISREALDVRVLKVLRAKAAVGLHKGRYVDVEEVAARVSEPDDLFLAQEIADKAVALLKDDSEITHRLTEEKRRAGGTSASRPAYDQEGGNSSGSVAVGAGTVALVFTDDVRSDWGRAFARELRLRIPDAKVIAVDADLAAPLTETVMNAVLDAKVVIMALYSIPSGGKIVRTANGERNTVALSVDADALVRRVFKSAGDKTAVVALGNPYLAADYPDIRTYLCTFSHVPTSEAAAVKALFGEIPIHGHTPVTIPGVAARGTGIEREVLARRRPTNSAPSAQVAMKFK